MNGVNFDYEPHKSVRKNRWLKPALIPSNEYLSKFSLTTAITETPSTFWQTLEIPMVFFYMRSSHYSATWYSSHPNGVPSNNERRPRFANLYFDLGKFYDKIKKDIFIWLNYLLPLKTLVYLISLNFSNGTLQKNICLFTHYWCGHGCRLFTAAPT